MPFLTKDDFKTHLYPEITAIITRGQDAIVTTAINKAVAEMKAYLNRYDLIKLFGDTTANPATDPTYTDDLLKSLGIDISVWHLLVLANPNVNIELCRTRYEDAIKFLKDVMKGLADPTWPLRTDDPGTGNDDAGNVIWTSFKKRTNNY